MCNNLKVSSFIVLFLILAVFKLHAQDNDRVYFQNPIISGFNPDPSICKVGDDYYLVTSTFEYFPGVPIYHSTDLVNWEHIGNVLNRPSQLNLDGCKPSMGIFAPCIRYNEGTFYMITTLVGGGGDFIVTATNPEGPWSDPHWIKDAPGIDPDLLFDDDGKVYMSGTLNPKEKVWSGHKNIWTQELDITKWELIGEKVITIDGGLLHKNGGPMKAGNENYLNAIEGPHFYKKEGWYYATLSIGGTDQNHAYVILRSKNVFGPYEENPNNPILTHRDLSRYHQITATGHADLFQIDGDQWGIVYLAKRPIFDEKPVFWRSKNLLGRESFLSLVDWSGEWPIVNPNGQVGRSEMIQNKPHLKENKFNTEHWLDDFNSKDLHPQWTQLRTPRYEWWKIDESKGLLGMELRPETIREMVNPSFIAKRQEHVNFSATTKISFKSNGENEEAGLLLERNNNNYIKYTLNKVDKSYQLCVAFRSGETTTDSIIVKTKVATHELELKMTVVGTLYSFSYSSNGKEWITIAEGFDVKPSEFLNNAPFTGPMVGMYASSNGKPSKSIAYFDWFNYKTY